MRTISKIQQKLAQSGTRGLLAAVLREAAGRIEGNSEHPQHLAYRTLSRYTSFDGKTVLELGGNQSCESALPFLQDGAKKVLVTGLDHIVKDHTNESERLIVMRADALQLSTMFQPNSFDIVYGLSVVEHIPSPSRLLDEVYTIMKPNGFAFFEGNPLWSSAMGHHIWVSASANGRTANYFFTNWPGLESTNPLPDWSHLLMAPGEMKELLHRDKIPEVDANLIVDWVYHGNGINRLSAVEIARAYANSRLTTLEANTSRRDVPSEIQVALRNRHGDLDYGIDGISYVMAKL